MSSASISLSPRILNTLTLDEAKLLIGLCRQGKLYEIEKWISSGKSLHVPPELKTTPLQVALPSETEKARNAAHPPKNSPGNERNATFQGYREPSTEFYKYWCVP